MSVLQQLSFSISITGPICLMLFLGIYLKRTGLINENFIDVGSKLVFQITLPIMLFLSIVTSKLDFSSSSSLILYGLIANILFFILTSLVTRKLYSSPKDQGVIIQGGFRANSGIIGLAYVINTFGHDSIAVAAIYVSSITLLYNVLAVIALSPSASASGNRAFSVILKTLTKNPLMHGILLGLVIYATAIPVPQIVVDAGQYFANMTLPLALLCTGGSLDFRSLKHEIKPAWFATIFRLILCPLLLTLGGLALGFRGLELGIIYLMSAGPAAASYVMARAMGGNAQLAANIIALTTFMSLVTTTLGIFILSTLKLI